MKVWVVGSGGMLGKTIVARLGAVYCEVVQSDLELDIADAPAVEAFAAAHRPDVVINCAAFTAVDAAEQDEPLALRVNGAGPSILAAVCLEHASTLLHVSTDYVFDGVGTEPYLEGALVCPKNAYGRTKLAGEESIQRLNEGNCGTNSGRWYVFRTSWLFGDGKSSFVETMWRLMVDKPELRVVDDQVGRPTYVEDLAGAMLRACGIEGTPPLPSGIWHFANEGVTSWHGFASAIRDAMVEAGVKVRTERILPVGSEEFPRPASRPQYSVLSTRKLESAGIVPRPWQSALHEYIQARARREVAG